MGVKRMSEKEYKTKCENMFAQNTVLINENEQLKKRIREVENDSNNCITTRNFWRVVNRRFPRSSYNYKINYTCHS